MRKALACALGVALLFTSLGAGAESVAQYVENGDLSWWGQSGATPAPVKDESRSGYWWWPTEPTANADDSELWGNRGVVYSMYTEPTVTPPPPPPPPNKVVTEPTRTTPVFAHVLFDFDKSVLKPEGKAEVDKVTAELKAHPKDSLEIEGHTCNVGEEAYNQGLGERRAKAVMGYLVESGIEAGRLSAVSYGETKPAVPNDTPANRKLNRRAQFNYKLVN